MTEVDAIYQNGVFKPLAGVSLPENKRVRLRFEPIDREEALAWLEQTRKIREEIAERVGILPDSTLEIAEDRQRDI